MVKKKAAKKKSAPKKKAGAKRPPSRRGDRSRIDLRPLKDHIRRRIKDLEEGGPAAAAAPVADPDDTVKRLKRVLDTLAEICFPTMDVPI